MKSCKVHVSGDVARRLMAFGILLACIGRVLGGGGEIQFNRDIRPILSENCFYCHGQDGNKRKADLRLDRREPAVAAGALVPFDVEASELVRRVFAEDAFELMPPHDSNRVLTGDQKALLKRWVGDGARYEEHWAFVAPERPDIPEVARGSWVRNPIDSFVLAKLEAVGWQPSPEADRATLIKRLSVDLTGLPPSAGEVQAFLLDNDPLAYERLVDRLLSSPHYGERMALPWLDAARYADSNGFQQDGDTWQWIWRDWVVRAFNDNMPFDRFSIWQLAGDLLPEGTADQKVASAFNRNHLLNGEGGAIAEEQRFVVLFDRIDTTATTWLGLTMACAQCHDHKYDPITQKDYYSLMDAFNRVPERGVPTYFSSRMRIDTPYLELPTAENEDRIRQFARQIELAEEEAAPLRAAAFAGWRRGILADGTGGDVEGMTDELKALLGKPEGERSDAEKEAIESGLRDFFERKVRAVLGGEMPVLVKAEEVRKQLDSYRKDQVPKVMVMSDDQPRETHILNRGQYLSPLERVQFATPAFLPPLAPDAPANRLGLARWLFSPQHPLTARVQVNRMWQQFFGLGIVKTSEDFGVQSEYPVHRELLDWLAVEFRESGWNVKAMHRLIVTSATYRQSSRLARWHLERDPDNRFYGRAARFRMPSMVLRDWALGVSGLLEREVGGMPVYPYQPRGVWDSLAITKERDFTYPASHGEALYRRSLYTFWRRTVSPANMFDSSARQACRVRSSTTSTPLHALVTLNDPTWVEAARVLAESCVKASSTLREQVAEAFCRAACRRPRAGELDWLLASYGRQLEVYRQDGALADELLAIGESPRDEAIEAAQHAAFTALCLMILNLDESMTRE
ncbi:MAG: hypothetical protein RI897_2288 [Verrucomicrobiota bacterium]|jgi:hypothetical protein